MARAIKGGGILVNPGRWPIAIRQHSAVPLPPFASPARRPVPLPKGQKRPRREGSSKKNEADHSDTEITYQTSPHTSHCARALALFDRSVSPWNAAWSLQTCAMRGTAKKAAMEGASEELERRSQYLSSLIQRTKIRGDGDQEKEVAEATIKPERRGQVQVHRVSKQEKVGDYLIAASNQETKEVVRPVVKPERTEHLHVQRQTTKEKEMEEEQDKKKKKSSVGDGDDPSQGKQLQQQEPSIKIRAADMPPSLQKRAFRCARETLASMPKLESKRLALALKKEFDSTYGPAWHCIVGTSFGSYVTHSLGGFLYFSIDKVYILLFRTAVEPVNT